MTDERVAGAGRAGRPSRLERELADAAYYLREGCEPCAERHFDLARRRGATEGQIEAVRARESRAP